MLSIPHGPAFMSLRIWHRLFLAFAALSILAMTAFALLQTRSFQNGFLDYVNRLEREKIESLTPSVEAAYAAHGSWDFLRGDTRQLMRTLALAPQGGRGQADFSQADFGQADFGQAASGGERADTPRYEERRRPPPRDRPPPRFRDGRNPPPSRNAEGLRPQPQRDGPPPGADRSPISGPRPRRPAHDLPPRLLLLDAGGEVVAGNPRLPRDTQAIDIQQQGQVVGRLLLAPLPRLRSDLDLEFARQQRQHMAVIALVVLLAALALAWALSRWLLRPVRELAAGTHALSTGDFAARIPGTRNDELGALARDFNALAETLERHRDARRQWGADIAHELRTPINVLSGEIQALQDGIRVVTPERLASLQAECGRLQHLVDDLYQLALSDAGALSYRFEPIDLADLVHAAVAAHGDGMREAGIELVVASVSAPCPLAYADRERLRQLLDNLLSNALRYTDRPGRVSVTLECDAAECTLRVDDTAPGVPAASLPLLFERLYRVEPSRSRQFGGAGLGLAICRNIVEAHGGRISASPSPRGGLRIEVVLPVVRKTT